MFNQFKPNPQPQRQNKPQGEGCKAKIRRDAHGRMVGYSDNGQCTTQQIKALFNDNSLNKEEVEED